MCCKLIFTTVLLAGAASGGVTVRAGLFPSDALTVEDAAQKTGRRVNLPLPDCDARPADCQDIRRLNQLDGFSPNARLRVGFSAPVNPKRIEFSIILAKSPAPPGHVEPRIHVVIRFLCRDLLGPTLDLQ